MMIITFVFLFISQTILAWQGNSTSQKNRKLLNLFQVTTFQNVQCSAANGSNGTCLSTAECSGVEGGFASGSCALGFGTCCVVSTSSCGGTVTRNITYVRNPGYPSGYSTAGTCEWTIDKCQNNICQIRLDFETMEIADPEVSATTTGLCSSDSFQGFQAQTGADTPLICGLNTGQHIYLDAASSTSNEARIRFTLGGTFAAQWNILVTMIECSSQRLPPTGCLQYFTGTTGTVSSFNLRDGCSGHPCTHLLSQQYTSCIRQESGYCSIGWREPADTNNHLHLTGGSTRETSGTGGFCDQTVSNRGDYVIIPEGVNSGIDGTQGCLLQDANGPVASNFVSRYCGGALNCIFNQPQVEIISTVVPFSLGVVFNNEEGDGLLNRGFQLNYRQIVC